MLRHLEQRQTATWFTICIEQWIVRLRDLLQGSLGEKKWRFQRNIKGKLYHQLYDNGIRQLCMLLLDGGVSFQYDGEAGMVIAMTTRDFLLRASWPSKFPQLLYWESNLLNISPPPTLFPINLFLGKMGVHNILKDVEEISKMPSLFATSLLLKRDV